MAQHDVYPNPQIESRPFMPYVVDVQSNLIDCLSTRLMVPLSRVGARLPKLPVDLSPVLSVDGESLSLQPHLSAPVVTSSVRYPAMNLQRHASDIAAAIVSVVCGV
ncbi:MAG TPA: CcdB family protein [Rhodoferax sp.]|nr:CcdB family protein [Rhodoferax sp.]